ncbi:MAG TPA: HAMP domain-containing sensor histidine kinase [Pirellulales bacterium]
MTLPNGTPAQRIWHAALPYVFAGLTLLVATLVRLALAEQLGEKMFLFTYLFAVIVVAWFAGVGPALATLVVSVPLAAWFFIPPYGSLLISGGTSFLAVGAYFLQGLAIVAFGASLRQMRNRAARTKELYENQSQQVAVERKRLHRDLQQLTEELREVDKRREDFLSLLADELRRPLVPIVSATSFLDIAATASEMESAMEVVKRETSQLGRLIEELLTVFRDGQGSVELHRQRLDLATGVCRAAESVRSLVAQTGRQLSVSLAKEPLWVDGDPTRLERVVYNLLVNAVRSTPTGGHIWLTAREENGHALVIVKDTGIGLDSAAQARVFEPFRPNDSPFGREGGLFRIGLIAVKQIVELHGGSVEVTSEGVGKGTQYTVRLPMIQVPAKIGETPAPV